jgi:hypothetical protein
MLLPACFGRAPLAHHRAGVLGLFAQHHFQDPAQLLERDAAIAVEVKGAEGKNHTGQESSSSIGHTNQ